MTQDALYLLSDQLYESTTLCHDKTIALDP